MDYESVKNVTVSSSVFTGTTNGVRIKTWANSKPGSVDQVAFIQCTMINVQNPILIDQHYCPHNKDCPGQVMGYIRCI
jgi:polygalacturonase